jgi:hypothetical protein
MSGFEIKGTVRNSDWGVIAAKLLYENDVKEPLVIGPKYIESDPETGEFTISVNISEVISVPQKRIELYLCKGYRTIEIAYLTR